MLRASGEFAGDQFDLGAVTGSRSGTDSGVPDGDILIAFVEAVLGDDEQRLEHVRGELYDRLGSAALVDAAGAVASFNAVVKVADGSGIRVDDVRQEAAAKLSAEMGLPFKSR